MAYSTFAAIDVGSGELACKIYEISKKMGIRELDYARQSLPLGEETYRNGRISPATVDTLCQMLMGFSRKMEEYQVESYVAYATTALRHAANSVMVLEQIKMRTGLKVRILSNSEQRFFYYKGMAAVDGFFDQVLGKTTAIVDVGAGSVQISVLKDGTFAFTQNIEIGILRVLGILSQLGRETALQSTVTSEYMNNELSTFRRLNLRDTQVTDLISVSDHLASLRPLLMKNQEEPYLTRKNFLEFCSYVRSNMESEVCKQLSIPPEELDILIPTLLIYEEICRQTGVERIWLSSATFCDGIAVDYCERKEKIVLGRDFTQDILSATRAIATRYQCNMAHIDQVEYLALAIFDAVAKPYGLTKRDRLLLRLAAILHACGEFVNLNHVADNSYAIVMDTEIIGVSHKERELVANIIRYDVGEFPRYTAYIGDLSRDNYLKVAKLTSILRLANVMDKSHLQKFSNVKVSIRGNQLMIVVSTLSDMTLEQGLFQTRTIFFSEVFGITPVLRGRQSGERSE